MPLVSVIVPVYNGEDTIAVCIESITAQTMKDIEIIVINDGSADNTLKILEGIHDSRIRVITTENNGQGYARNRGIDAAEGEYLAFVDADDTIERDMLETMYSAAVRDNSDIVQCNLYDVYQGGEKRVQLDTKDETAEIQDKGYYTDKYFTPCRHSYEVCNKLIKKESIGGLRFKDTKKYFSEDLLFNLELISRIHRITFVSKPLYNYFQHKTSHMNSDAEKRLNGLRALFRDCIAAADGDMRGAASYTAAMILTYSAGDITDCEKLTEFLGSSELNYYISRALRRNCKLSHRLFLSAMLISPPRVRVKLVRMYGGRWK